jgi:hypothetical protein
MNRYYTVHITPGTTSPGPYTIYWDSMAPDNIATIYGSSTFASGLTINQLTGTTGINVVVPDSTSYIYLYNTYCNTNQRFTATTIDTLYNFCMTVIIAGTTPYKIHFVPDGVDSNGKHKWISDNYGTYPYVIVWNPTLLRWELNTWPLINGVQPTVYSSLSSYPPLSGWKMIGVQSQTDVTISQGNCGVLSKKIVPITINQPKCSCDGNISINPNSLDGNPPYIYSIDNGVTYSTSPFFTNLCSGIYNIKAKDSYNYVYTNTATLSPSTQPTTYTLTLNTITSTITSNTTTLIKEEVTTVNVSPSLPSGVEITFDVIHNNLFNSSPNSSTSTLITNTELNKNSYLIPLSFSGTSTGTTVNTIPGCQDLLVYQSGFTENWTSLSMINTDTITLTTITNVVKNEITVCTIANSSNTYSIMNPQISGCDCCNIIIV